MDTKVLRLEEAAGRANLSLGFLRREIVRGEIEVIRIGRLIRISDSALAEYLSKRAERAEL